MVDIKAGQWWTEKGTAIKLSRIFVTGFSTDGKIVIEWSNGQVSSLGREYFLKYKELLPDCTGWDWQPEVYPQYRETYQPEEFAFVRLDDKNTFTFVWKDGTEDPPGNHAYTRGRINERAKLTEEEALARIVKPTVTPGEGFELLGPDDVVCPECGFNYTDNSRSGWPAVCAAPWFRVGWTVRSYLDNEFSSLVFRRPVKPAPKTKTIKVHTVAYGYYTLKFVSKVLDTELDSVKRDWQVFTILKTEEFEVSCG